MGTNQAGDKQCVCVEDMRTKERRGQEVVMQLVEDEVNVRGHTGRYRDNEHAQDRPLTQTGGFFNTSLLELL